MLGWFQGGKGRPSVGSTPQGFAEMTPLNVTRKYMYHAQTLVSLWHGIIEDGSSR